MGTLKTIYQLQLSIALSRVICRRQTDKFRFDCAACATSYAKKQNTSNDILVCTKTAKAKQELPPKPDQT